MIGGRWPSRAVPRRLGARQYLAYGALRAPLALLELPLFVLLPAYYSQHLGVDLALVGITLFIARLVDAGADPMIGLTLDQPRTRSHRRTVIWLTLPLLALAYSALFWPPPGMSPALWLGTTSIVAYLSYSVISIAYQAWGTQIGTHPTERVQLTAWREGCGLVGVLLSAAFLQPQYALLLVSSFIVLAVLAGVLLRYAPQPESPIAAAPAYETTARAAAPLPANQASWRSVFRYKALRWLLGIFICNGIATAIPATLLLFYVSDVLQTPHYAPLFLVTYFLAAALGMPAWPLLARHLGLRRTWLVGMALAIAAFLFAYPLESGAVAGFLIVCGLTGLALGADLALPAALLATVLAAPGAPAQREATVLGAWNLATKLNLAIAAGVALPALALLGYTPNTDTTGQAALAAVYALVPCALKLIAAGLLAISPLSLTDTHVEVRR